ncbi:MAG: hypothetical protein JXR70_12310 [Spirochaetales bacterium]|nr:hypothetical protein [Spirochaetales bacterium]
MDIVNPNEDSRHIVNPNEDSRHIVNPDEDSRRRAANRRFVTRPATSLSLQRFSS